jgi:hypothetical protein
MVGGHGSVMLGRRWLVIRRVLRWRGQGIARGRRRRRRDAGSGTCMVVVRGRRGPGRQRGIHSPFPRTRRRVRRGLTFITIYPRTFQITFTILLRLTLGSLAASQRLARSGDIGKRVVIIRSVIVVFVSHFTFTITFVLRDGYAWPQRLAISDREVGRATAGLSLANVLADSYFDALVSK